jgi:predicted alpha/beta-hydrolase family hydrolase
VANRSGFYDLGQPRTAWTVGARTGWYPVYFYDNQVFSAMHTASFDAVAAMLPSDKIVPVGREGGRALVAVTAYRYGTVVWSSPEGEVGGNEPYGEVLVAAVVTRARSTSGLSSRGRQSLAGFVLQLPVTTRQACVDGRQLLGYPKFVADMHFTEQEETRKVRVAEGGRDVLTFSVRTGGLIISDRLARPGLGTLHGQLIETTSRVRGHMQVRPGGRSGRLELGDHEAGRQLASLQISPTPVTTLSYLDHTMMIPGAPQSMGACADYVGYVGSDRIYGHYTVTYPTIGTIELHPHYATTTP